MPEAPRFQNSEKSKYSSAITELISISLKKETFDNVLPSICNGSFSDFEGTWALLKIIYDKVSGYVPLNGTKKDVQDWEVVGRDLSTLSRTISAYRTAQATYSGPEKAQARLYLANIVRLFVALHEKITRVTFNIRLSVEVRDDIRTRARSEEEPEI
jgi:hypothetical protein